MTGLIERIITTKAQASEYALAYEKLDEAAARNAWADVANLLSDILDEQVTRKMITEQERKIFFPANEAAEFEDGELTPFFDEKTVARFKSRLGNLEALDRLSMELTKELLALLGIAEWQKRCGDIWLENVHFDYSCQTCGGVRELIMALEARIQQDVNNRMLAASDLALIDMHVPNMMPPDHGSSDFGFVNKFDASGRSLSGGDIA